MTQGKSERYFRSIKNLILLDLYYSQTELEIRIGEWVEYYNSYRCQEAIDKVARSDNYFGRGRKILKQREKTKTETMKHRRRLNQSLAFLVLASSTSAIARPAFFKRFEASMNH